MHQPDRTWKDLFGEPDDVGSSLYYASFLGLQHAVDEFLQSGVEVNARGGHFGNALQAASQGGDEKVEQMLMDAGAEVNAPVVCSTRTYGDNNKPLRPHSMRVTMSQQKLQL